MKTLFIAILSLATCCYAQEKKAAVELKGTHFTISGGIGHEVRVKVERPFGEPLSVEEKIVALKEKLHFYELVSQHMMDFRKEINAVYADRPLKSILAELLPNVRVTFEGVDSGVTVENMVVEKAPVEIVCQYLDIAAGVYFRFTEQGITVTAKPPTK